MPPYRPIHIALTFNDKYWALAYTVMRSICLSSRLRQEIVFHLCHSALTADHLATLEAIRTEFGSTIRHYDPDASPAFRPLTQNLRADDRFPAIVYTRLLLDKLLPPEVERVIYLDCDTLVRRPIEELYDFDMMGMAIAAVADPYHDGIKLGRDIRTKQSPFDSADPYFNSGVLLIDLKGFALANVPGRVAEFASTGTLAQLYYDQDLLNMIFAGNWLELPWRFNLLNPRPTHETLGPAIIHYTGHRRPWALYSGTAFARTYRHVMTNEVFYKYWRERRFARLARLLQRRAK